MSGDFIDLHTEGARARIALHGGELLAWTCGARELIWSPDLAIWDRTSPLLFPVVGWCSDGICRVDGSAYRMGVHGFAMHCDFTIVDQSATQVTLRLWDSAETRQHYPFAFEFDVTYRLSRTQLSIDLRIENTGDREMPFACGMHPGFRWPLSGERAGHCIEFAAREDAQIPVIAAGGLFSPERRTLEFDGRRLMLDETTFAREALCFLDARSRGVDFVGSDGGRLRVEFKGFRHLALWSKPFAPFVCIEGWTGHGDPVDFHGDLGEKPSMILLAPRQESRHGACFAWSEPAPTGVGASPL